MTAQLAEQLPDKTDLVLRDPEPEDANEPFPEIDDEDAEDQS